MSLLRRLKKSFSQKFRYAKYHNPQKSFRKLILFPLVQILVLALIICQEIYFLKHYEMLLTTCENVTYDLDNFRNLDISNDVLNLLWENSMGSKESYVKKITMNMLLNNFKVTDKKEIIGSNWYFWDRLIPEELYEYYYDKYKTIFSDLIYFPVAEDVTNGVKVTFEDTWMKERTYGGKRGHEGTDIMAENNRRGYFPVISITDGTVEQKGWLEKGGYRIGIRSYSGAYFYYAHLDSYNPDLDVGDTVLAGELLGMMGDTGYSKVEGTTGNFDVHLHMGIYINEGNKEISVNPYWVLKYLWPYRIPWTEEQ